MVRSKKKNPNLRLHMIGKLQSNKAKDAVKLLIIFILWIIKN